MNAEKLAKLQAQVRIGGRGMPRRKVKKVHHSEGTDDKKLHAALKKLNIQPVPGVEEVNMFKEDGNVVHFVQPKVHVASAANTFCVYGRGQTKELTELVPGILSQLGPDSLASLRKLAESYQAAHPGALAAAAAAAAGNDGEDDVPELVENFDETVEDKAE
ncbi:putative transcription factor BTF3a [Piptocephalis cylindrospora]|uniref:Nascent polypeptide-associated complex subunit beta n=1 Tax=Piptocephalis cylindrospora TaxID=1907219 RepID=A0A4P9Y9H1_9FUNG|nr:putative transcription factor BTF3a [Piptocephalis cylindrospora]|eukprot:RKP15452.1 putative transcription factor BTF3a [Piptocephalis cylindrospora]